MAKYKSTYWICLFMGILLSSCNNDNLGFSGSDTPNEPEKEIELRISVPTNSSANKTKSISTDAESAVSSIYALSFKVNTDGSETFQYAYQATEITTGNYHITVRVQENEQRFVLIANAPDQMTKLLNDLPTYFGQEKDFVLASLEVGLDYADDRWRAISDEDFTALPMWGESSKQIITGTTKAIDESVSLLRMVAKVEVMLDTTVEGLTELFQLKSVYLYNSNRNGRIAPDADKITKSEDYISVIAPTLPTEVEAAKDAIKYTDFSSPGVKDVSMKGAIYTFETEAPTDDDSQAATCLVIGGTYADDAEETFYRVDFIKDGDYLDVLRNHKYVVNIVGVQGSGYATPEIAFTSKAINLNTDILYWDEAGLNNVVFDGQYSLAVSTDSVMMWREEQKGLLKGYNIISILTDYDTGWYLEGIEYEDDGASFTTEWLSFSANSGEANQKAQVGVLVDENTTGKTRTAMATIAAGRLRFQLKVVQNQKETLAMRIYDEADEEVSSMYFHSYKNQTLAPKSFTVKWTPASANLSSAVNQLSSFEFVGTGMPTSGIYASDGSGEKTFTIQPESFGVDNPFAERVASYHFAVTDGETIVTQSITVHQSCYEMLFDIDGNGYVLGGQVETINVRSNYNWIVSQVDDPDDILQDEETMLLGLAAGNKPVYGDEIRFKMGEPTLDQSKNDKTATIYIQNIDDNTEIALTLRAEEHLFMGYFAGEVVEDADGKRHFAERLYVQNVDESTSVKWQTTTDAVGVVSNHTGKQNTLDLMNIAGDGSSVDFPAARKCFEKNNRFSTITSVDDENYVWYMPASSQLFAIWIVENSFADGSKMSTSSNGYWSSAEMEGNTIYAFVVGFYKNQEGHTWKGNIEKTGSGRLRCVRKAK
ncbi:MAG: hypothetical protein ACK5LR_06755 [Mangrovibacterium sp.]